MSYHPDSEVGMDSVWVTPQVKKCIWRLMKYAGDRWWELGIKTVRCVNVYRNLKLESPAICESQRVPCTHSLF